MQFDSLKKTLDNFGLFEISATIAEIEKIYKIAFVDLTKEREVIQALSSLLQELSKISLTDYAPEGSYLPPYSTTTSTKNIVYSGESLSGYPKSEIMKIGIPNFLKSFTGKYMQAKLSSLSGDEYKKYERLQQELRTLGETLSTYYSKITKPIELSKNVSLDRSKNLGKRELEKSEEAILKALQAANTFKIRIQDQEGYLYYLMYAKGMSPDTEEFEEDLENASADDLFARELDKKYIHRLKTLSLDFNSMKKEIESKYASKLGISIEELNDLLSLGKFFITKKANYGDDLLENARRVIDQMPDVDMTKYKMYQKALRDVLKGDIVKVTKEKDAHGKMHVVKTLMPAEEVLGAWEYLKSNLRMLYEAFIQSAIEFKALREQQDNFTYQSREQLDRKNKFSKGIDEYALAKLKSLTEVLNA